MFVSRIILVKRISILYVKNKVQIVYLIIKIVMYYTVILLMLFEIKCHINHNHEMADQ